MLYEFIFSNKNSKLALVFRAFNLLMYVLINPLEKVS